MAFTKAKMPTANVLLVEPYGDRMGHFGLFAAQTAQELAALGNNVLLVTGTHLNAAEYLDAKPEFQLEEVGIVDCWLSAKATAGSRWLRRIMHGFTVIRINIAAVTAALKRTRRQKFDVIHLLSFEALTTAMLITWYRVFAPLPPLVVHLNPVDFSVSSHKRNPIRGAYKVLACFALRYLIRHFCLAVTVQGEWHRARITRQLDCELSGNPPFIVLRPGTSLPSVPVDRREARRRLGISPDTALFLFLGVLRKDKGLELLLEAVDGLRGNWQLLIAGAPFDWTADSLHEAIRQCSSADRIHSDIRYIPEPELPNLLEAADAVVLPYHGQNYPGNYGPVSLACAHGRPIIASDLGEMGYLVRERQLGLAVPPDDPQALRAALQQFLGSGDRTRAGWAEAGRALAAECSFAAIARALTKIYASQYPPADSAAVLDACSQPQTYPETT